MAEARPANPTEPSAPPVIDRVHDGDTAQWRLRVGGDCPWLEGHFPERPVLPGVVLLRWAIQAAGDTWPELDTVTGVSNLKFRNPVLPPAEVVLHLAFDASRRRIDFRYARDGKDCAQGRVRFA